MRCRGRCRRGEVRLGRSARASRSCLRRALRSERRYVHRGDGCRGVVSYDGADGGQREAEGEEDGEPNRPDGHLCPLVDVVEPAKEGAVAAERVKHARVGRDGERAAEGDATDDDARRRRPASLAKDVDKDLEDGLACRCRKGILVALHREEERDEVEEAEHGRDTDGPGTREGAE